MGAATPIFPRRPRPCALPPTSSLAGPNRLRHPPPVNFILTNGRSFFAQRAGLDLYLASQKKRCADFDTCPAEKLCFRELPSVARFGQAPLPEGSVRKVNHLLVASEPIGEEDHWEPIPDGMLLALDEAMELHLYPATARFSLCPSPPAPRGRRCRRGSGSDPLQSRPSRGLRAARPARAPPLSAKGSPYCKKSWPHSVSRSHLSTVLRPSVGYQI